MEASGLPDLWRQGWESGKTKMSRVRGAMCMKEQHTEKGIQRSADGPLNHAAECAWWKTTQGRKGDQPDRRRINLLALTHMIKLVDNSIKTVITNISSVFKKLEEKTEHRHKKCRKDLKRMITSEMRSKQCGIKGRVNIAKDNEHEDYLKSSRERERKKWKNNEQNINKLWENTI